MAVVYRYVTNCGVLR